MCGIVGLFYRDGTVPDLSLLQRMLHSLKHRGPDDQGEYQEGSILLGHNRLSILDISSAGRQPMEYNDLVITYNGEIYNYLEIKAELKNSGHIFKTETDTEVLLHAYDLWGKECLSRITGMWAFAILDRKKQELFCCRDRFGIKPFYYYSDPRFLLAFASEIRALLISLGRARVSYELLMDYLKIGLSDHTEGTFYEAVKQLPPGHFLSLDLKHGQKRMERYYSLTGDEGGAATPEEFEDRLRRSVAIHMRSDVPVGTCLSGGIDSSVIAALSAAVNRSQGNKTFSAVTAQSESPLNDETAFARQVVEHCHLDWHVAKPDYTAFKNSLEDCLWYQEEPVGGPSVFMQYWVMKTAKEAGLKVMLDGQGGDEIMFGYERYYAAFFWHLLRQGQSLTCLREFFLAARHSKLKLGSLGGLTLFFLVPGLRRRVLEKRVAFLKKDYLNIDTDALAKANHAFFEIGDLQISEISSQQLPHLLKYEDRNSMAHSIEARVPYVEVDCIETSLRIPPAERIRNGYTKYPLRCLAERILPPSIAWRRNKFGFEAPVSLWLGRHRPLMGREVRDSAILRQICRFLPPLESLGLEMQWRLYNIAIWERLFNVQA